MSESAQKPMSAAAAAFLAASIGVFGSTVGYVVGARQQPPASVSAQVTAAPPSPSTMPTPGTALVDDSQITAYRNILTGDPKNAVAAIQLGDLLYDAGRFAEAVPYYRQALSVQPENANVSTDLGTALFYSGRPDEALAQYGVTLATDPNHAPTLFNIGVVRLEGKRDPRGAIEAWERLISAHPSSPDAAKARTRLEDAKRQLVGFSPIPLQPSR